MMGDLIVIVIVLRLYVVYVVDDLGLYIFFSQTGWSLLKNILDMFVILVDGFICLFVFSDGGMLYGC